jgi:hypothetical protein
MDYTLEQSWVNIAPAVVHHMPQMRIVLVGLMALKELQLPGKVVYKELPQYDSETVAGLERPISAGMIDRGWCIADSDYTAIEKLLTQTDLNCFARYLSNLVDLVPLGMPERLWIVKIVVVQVEFAMDYWSM